MFWNAIILEVVFRLRCRRSASLLVISMCRIEVWKTCEKKSQQKFEYVCKRRAASLTQCPYNLPPPRCLSISLSYSPFVSLHLLNVHCTLSLVPYICGPAVVILARKTIYFVLDFSISANVYRKRAHNFSLVWRKKPHQIRTLVPETRLCRMICCAFLFLLLVLFHWRLYFCNAENKILK